MGQSVGWRVEIGKPAKASEQMAYEKEPAMREMQVQNSRNQLGMYDTQTGRVTDLVGSRWSPHSALHNLIKEEGFPGPGPRDFDSGEHRVCEGEWSRNLQF